MSAISYPRFSGLVIAEAEGDARSLNQEVWKHERAARSHGMPLVVEVYARSVLASRRLTDWWQSGDQLMQDTLGGVYLLRVDLQRFGPQAVLKLTPYAVAGAPLFVAWTEIGQVCSRTQFQELTREAFVLPLSAFIDDVLKGRQHSLNPAPTLGNAERTREAVALRRAAQTLLSAKRLERPTVVFPPTVNEPVGVAVTKVDTDQPPHVVTTATAALQPIDPLPAPIPHVVELDLLLERARDMFAVLEERVGAPLKLTLADLRTIDGYLADMSEKERATFARELGAVLAIYVGDTIRQRVTCDWFLSDGATSAATQVELRGNVLNEKKSVQPMEWVVEILSDPTRSLYGQALSWCRIY